MTATIHAPVTAETLPVIAHQGVLVVTTDLLAQLYGTDNKNIQMNFANNADRFELGKHYVKLTGESLREFKHQPNVIGLVARNTAHLLLWTERGAARHAKMLDTDQAWEVFERLEDAYFRPASAAPAASAVKESLTAPADPITREVRAAINRKAHTLSLRHYDRLREDLLEAVRKHAGHPGGERDPVRGSPFS